MPRLLTDTFYYLISQEENTILHTASSVGSDKETSTLGQESEAGVGESQEYIRTFMIHTMQSSTG